MPQTLRHFLVLVAVSGVVMFTNLGGPRLWDRDEPRNAGCAAEMLARGDWVTPFFNGELRTHKPILLYWLMMTAYGMFGVNEFAARFWSAALGMGTVLATYGMGRRLFGANVGLWAGVILASSLMFDMAARAATPDSPLIFFATLPILVYVLGVFKPRSAGADEDGAPQLKHAGRYFPSSWPTVCLLYALMGVAVLAKGPVGLVLPTAVIGMFLLIVRLPARQETAPLENANQNRAALWLRRGLNVLRPFAPLHFLRTCWSMRPLTALAVSLAVALPWYLWVGARTDGDWLRGFFFEHNLGRATQAMEGHRGGLWFYPLALLVGFFPWSVLAAPLAIDAVLRLRRGDKQALGYLLAMCWVGVYVGLFSLAQTKLPSYVTPCYPALALLAGCFVHHWVRETELAARFWPYVSFSALAIVGSVMLVAMPIAANQFLPGEEWLGAIGLIPLVGGIVCWRLTRRGARRPAALTLAGVSIATTTLVFGFVLWRVDRHQQIDRLLAAIETRSADAHIGALGVLEPSWVYYSGRTVYFVELWPNGAQAVSAAQQALAAKQEKPWLPNPTLDAVEFLSESPDAFVITTRERLEQVRADLPPQFVEIAAAPYFLRDHQLVVLGWSEEAVRTARAPRSDAKTSQR